MQMYLVNKFGWLKTLRSKYKLLSCSGQAAYETSVPTRKECSAALRRQEAWVPGLALTTFTTYSLLDLFPFCKTGRRRRRALEGAPANILYLRVQSQQSRRARASSHLFGKDVRGRGCRWAAGLGAPGGGGRSAGRGRRPGLQSPSCRRRPRRNSLTRPPLSAPGPVVPRPPGADAVDGDTGGGRVRKWGRGGGGGEWTLGDRGVRRRGGREIPGRAVAPASAEAMAEEEGDRPGSRAAAGSAGRGKEGQGLKGDPQAWAAGGRAGRPGKSGAAKGGVWRNKEGAEWMTQV